MRAMITYLLTYFLRFPRDSNQIAVLDKSQWIGISKRHAILSSGNNAYASIGCKRTATGMYGAFHGILTDIDTDNGSLAFNLIELHYLALPHCIEIDLESDLNKNQSVQNRYCSQLEP